MRQVIKYSIYILGMTNVLLGAAAMIGWHYKIDSLIQIDPNIVPLVYNTALCFVLSGILLILLNLKNIHNVIVSFISAGVFLIGTLVLCEYLFSIDLKIDNLIVFPYNITMQVHPGRMAPNTALAFIFVGIAMFCLGQKNHKPLKFSVALVCSFVVLGLALVCLFAYFSSAPSLAFWEKFTSMAPNTAIGLIILSVGVVLLIFRLSESQDFSLSRWLPYIVASYALMTVTLFWLAFKVEEIYGIKKLSSIVAQHAPESFNYEYHGVISNAIFVLGILLSILLLFTMRYAQLGKVQLVEIDKIRQSFERAQQLVHLGIWVWDLERDTFWCSQEILRILGLPMGINLLKSDDYLKLLTSEERSEFKSAIDKLINRNCPTVEIQNIIHVNNIEKIVQLEAKISKENNEVPAEVTGIMQDITERTLLERQLMQAQKMEVLGQLTGGLARDYNNILMLISGNIELLSKELTLNENQHRRIETALSAVEKGSDLTKRLLGFSRQQSLKPQKVLLSEILPGFVKMITPVLGEAIELAVKLEPNVWGIWIDPTQLQTALLNLVVNARDAMNGQGKLFIQVENYISSESLRAGKVKIEAGDYVKISVTDTGEGMPPEVLEHVFEPFFTTKSVGKGSGLGLSMVYGFVNQSRGYVTIYSEIHYGTTINLYLPRMTHENAVLIKTNENGELGDIQLDRILTIVVVEDDDALRKVTADYLTAIGHDVIAARNGPEALEILNQHEKVDLLLSDVIMPGGMTGIELALNTLRLKKNIKILLVTGYAKESLSLKNLPVDFQPEIMMKPYSFSDLNLKIKKMFDNK